MDQLLSFPSTMIWPLAATLVLTGIHVYLGVHVIARKVIFVDLALAQIAALGTVVGVLLGYEAGKDISALYLYSLAFTIFGAFIFSVTRMRGEKVPHEAIIGITYAVTFAATMLILSKSALGPQELDHIIKGELLWVQPHVVIKTAIIYSLVGIFHFVFRKNFMALSFDPQGAERSGMNVRLWDFLFYMSFGFVITSSVSIAGVFLVFSYLVIPSVSAMLLSDKLSTRLAIGWIGGAVISLIGVKLSWITGLPTSPLIVVVLAIGLLVSGTIRYLRHAATTTVALRNLAAAVAVVAIFVTGVYFFKKPQEDPLEHTMHLLTSNVTTDREAAIASLDQYGAEKAKWLPLVEERLSDDDAAVRNAAVQLLTSMKAAASAPKLYTLLHDPSDDVRRSAIEAVKTFGDGDGPRQLVEAATTEDDPEIKVELLETALELGNPAAIPMLIGMIKDGGIFAGDAYDHLQSHVSIHFRRGELSKVQHWWDVNREKLTWDPETKVFAAR